MLTFFAKKLVRCVEIIERVLPRVHIYHIEDIFVLLVLGATAYFSRGNYIEWIGVVAGFMAFKHIVIAFRLEDVLAQKEKNGDTAFHSHGKQAQFFYAKESIWLLYFVLLGAWSATISIVMFLMYPLWHKVRMKYHTGTKHLKKNKDDGTEKTL